MCPRLLKPESSQTRLQGLACTVLNGCQKGGVKKLPRPEKTVVPPDYTASWILRGRREGGQVRLARRDLACGRQGGGTQCLADETGPGLEGLREPAHGARPSPCAPTNTPEHVEVEIEEALLSWAVKRAAAPH